MTLPFEKEIKGKERKIYMATTTNSTKKKATSTATKVASEVKEDTVKENEALKVQIDVQKEQMAKMQAQMEAMMAMMGNNMNQSSKSDNGNRLIKFVSLKDATIVLEGTNFWNIEGRYASRTFPEKEARMIVSKMSNYLRQGSVYIDDAQFVHDNDLDGVYENLLSDKDLKSLLDKSVTDVIETYKNVNDNQKEIIIESIIADKKAGREIDNNILVTLSGLCGKDLVNLNEDDE